MSAAAFFYDVQEYAKTAAQIARRAVRDGIIPSRTAKMRP